MVRVGLPQGCGALMAGLASHLELRRSIARARSVPDVDAYAEATAEGQGGLVLAPTPDHAAPPAIEEVVNPLNQVEARDRIYRRLLAQADVIAALCALMVSITLLGDDQLRPATLLGLPLIVLVSKIYGLYDRDELLMRKSTMDEVPKLFQLATLYTLTTSLLDTQLMHGGLGHLQALVLWVTLFGFAVGARIAARWLAQRATPTERCLFVGDPNAQARVQSKLDRLDAEVVGRLSLRRENGAPRVVSTDELRDLIRWTNAHRVIVDPQTLPPEESLELLRSVKATGVRVSLLPRVLDVVGSAVVLDDLDGLTVMGVRRFGLSRSSRMVKRAFDVCGAALGVLAISPLLILLAIAIKLDSRGPVLFRQERVGRDGRRFRICKFRTMIADAEAQKDALREHNECEDGLFKLTDDPRVTRVGRFLRRTSLDELPQLLNVLRGEMSLVGPRPLVVDEDEQITGHDRRRLALTPGMTGHWQILGSSRVPMAAMVKIDYLYVASWSLWSDVKLLLRTVPYILARRGM